MRANMKIHNAERVAAHIANPNRLARPMHTMLERVAAAGERAAREGSPDSVARSMQSEVRGLHASVYSTHPAAYVIDSGRRAGAQMPPPDAIRAWLASKGITARTFVVARAIARRGIRGRFFRRAAQQAMQRALPGELARLNDSLAQDFNR